jgi:hypothetical protein
MRWNQRLPIGPFDPEHPERPSVLSGVEGHSENLLRKENRVAVHNEMKRSIRKESSLPGNVLPF